MGGLETDHNSAERGSARPGSFRHWRPCSIRPSACGNHEYVDWFRIAMELWIQHDGRVGQICTPNGTVHEWRGKNQVSNPGEDVSIVRKVLFLRHHVGHEWSVHRGQFRYYECL